jgi:hypothetical protein
MRGPDPRPASRHPGRVSARLRAGLACASGILSAVAIAGAALAASPTPTSALAGDPRSSGQGPGLVGNPAEAIAVVALVAVVTLMVTLLYVRATGGSPDR